MFLIFSLRFTRKKDQLVSGVINTFPLLKRSSEMHITRDMYSCLIQEYRHNLDNIFVVGFNLST